MTDIVPLNYPSGSQFYPQTHADAVINLAAMILANLKVLSVNQKTGTIVLTANDVGAYTKEEVNTSISNINYPVKSVNGKVGSIVLTPNDIGAQNKVLTSIGGNKFVLTVSDDGTLSTEPYEGS